MKSKNEKRISEGIGRRDFICKSALFCCAANIPFAASGISKNTKQEEKKSDVNPLELAAYCGLYCGACDIYQQRIGKSGNELKRVIDAYNFGDIANQVPGLEEYDSFYKTLNTLITFFGQCPACQKGGGPPQCPIRQCCKEKGYQTCAECSSFPCEKLKPLSEGYPQLHDNLKEIKEIGLEKWCQKQQEMVDKGFRYSDTLSKE
jgi:hypothetical protein